MRTTLISAAIAIGVTITGLVVLDRWFWLMRRSRRIIDRYLFTDDGLVPGMILIADLCVVSLVVYGSVWVWLWWLNT